MREHDERRAALLALLEDDGASLEARAEAGEALAALGDPRASAIASVEVPAGTFRFRRAPREGAGPKGEGADVFVSAFRIDRFAVTVAAFSEFLDAGGYDDASFWSERGFAWRRAERIEHPRFWGEAEWAQYLVGNHPVVGVSAYEAEAFAAFRGARLPTEAEWEKACRGTDGRTYPWSDAWLDDACAMRGYGPRRTLPIGCFPKGVSPFGARDLVGCVWQWCADVADESAQSAPRDPFLDPEGYDPATPRVTRGGAWNTLQWSCNCTSRNPFPPTARFSNLGFRCVVQG